MRNVVLFMHALLLACSVALAEGTTSSQGSKGSGSGTKPLFDLTLGTGSLNQTIDEPTRIRQPFTLPDAPT
jgi:hypothetical protein